jgi:hypothetical protein
MLVYRTVIEQLISMCWTLAPHGTFLWRRRPSPIYRKKSTGPYIQIEWPTCQWQLKTSPFVMLKTIINHAQFYHIDGINHI